MRSRAHAHRWRGERGVTLLDVLIGTALMLLIFIGIAGVFQLSIDVITNNRSRAGAIALLNERMEYLRSLSYTQIGVIGGIPAGNVPQEETVPLGDLEYTRRTFVNYTDDPGDGLGENDDNNITADYKTIRVEVIWESRQGERSITLVGRVSPVGIEVAVPGGTLLVNVVDESASAVSNAQVDIINLNTNPSIDIRTYTNVNGQVVFIGAPAASDYQITISKTGYSSAQTYPVTAENPNPDPRHLTVAESLTTSSDFVIDLLADKTVETYRDVQEGTWEDTFSDQSYIAETASTTVSGGAATLTGGVGAYDEEGSLQSISIAPPNLAQWKTFIATTSVPAQTSLLFRFYDVSGSTLIPEGQLPGNAAGFTATSIDLTNVSTTTYPAMRVTSALSSADPNETSSIDAYSFIYDYGPEPFPNLSFSMRSEKTIGNNPAVYKYDEELSSGSLASITLSDIEADTYTLGIASTTGYALSRSCEPQPETLLPGASQTTRLFVVPASEHSLLIDVRTDAGALLSGASAELSAVGYAVTELTGTCGQTFFSELNAEAYTLTVTLSGFDPYTTAVNVSGATHLSVVLNPE